LGDVDTVPACDNIDSRLASFSSSVANAASFLAFVAAALLLLVFLVLTLCHN